MTSSVVTGTFLLLNGYDFTTDEVTRLQIWSDLGAGAMSEEELATWLRNNIKKI